MLGCFWKSDSSQRCRYLICSEQQTIATGYCSHADAELISNRTDQSHHPLLNYRQHTKQGWQAAHAWKQFAGMEQEIVGLSYKAGKLVYRWLSMASWLVQVLLVVVVE